MQGTTEEDFEFAENREFSGPLGFHQTRTFTETLFLAPECHEEARRIAWGDQLHMPDRDFHKKFSQEYGSQEYGSQKYVTPATTGSHPKSHFTEMEAVSHGSSSEELSLNPCSEQWQGSYRSRSTPTMKPAFAELHEIDTRRGYGPSLDRFDTGRGRAGRSRSVEVFSLDQKITESISPPPPRLRGYSHESNQGTSIEGELDFEEDEQYDDEQYDIDNENEGVEYDDGGYDEYDDSGANAHTLSRRSHSASLSVPSRAQYPVSARFGETKPNANAAHGIGEVQVEGDYLSQKSEVERFWLCLSVLVLLMAVALAFYTMDIHKKFSSHSSEIGSLKADLSSANSRLKELSDSTTGMGIDVSDLTLAQTDLKQAHNQLSQATADRLEGVSSKMEDLAEDVSEFEEIKESFAEMEKWKQNMFWHVKAHSPTVEKRRLEDFNLGGVVSLIREGFEHSGLPFSKQPPATVIKTKADTVDLFGRQGYFTPETVPLSDCINLAVLSPGFKPFVVIELTHGATPNTLTYVHCDSKRDGCNPRHKAVAMSVFGIRESDTSKKVTIQSGIRLPSVAVRGSFSTLTVQFDTAEAFKWLKLEFTPQSAADRVSLYRLSLT